MLIRNKVLLGTIVFLFASAASLLHADESHARIVRISHAEGTVRLNNQDVTVSTPLIEGNVLTTGLESLAEIEFEDGSTLRLAPETQISLSQLVRRQSGGTVTEIDLEEGELELNMSGRKVGEFAIEARSKTIHFASRGRFRVLSTHSDPLELAVWKGEAVVHDKESGQDAAVESNEVFMLSAEDPRQYDIETGIETDALDQWSELRDQELTKEYVSTTTQPASPAPPVFSSVDFVDPCQAFYWYPQWYPGLFPDCFSPSFAFAPLAYVPFYPPVFYHHHHHHHPHIHPPTPPATTVVVHRTFYPKPVEPGRHAARIYNDKTFKRSVPVTEQREAKARSKAESREKAGSLESTSTRTADRQAFHRSEPTHSSDSHRSTNQSAHSSSSYSPHSSSSGSRSYSGGGSYSGASSHSSFSGGSSSAGASSHSSSSSATSSGSSGRSH